jgi:collagenase-like PrtC family protease
MKIVAPLNRLNEIEGLISAGADELYSGLVDWSQWQRFGGLGCINRRAEIFSNLNSIAQLKKAVDISHSHGVSFVLALNEYYNEAQCQLAIKQAELALDCGVDAVLVADIGLMLMLRDRVKGLKFYLSSCAPVFNLEAINFYVELGVSRIVLNRHLNIEELKELSVAANKKLEMETFVLNERCYNIDGFCSFEHGKCTNIFNFKMQQCIKSVMKKSIRFFPAVILNKLNNFLVKNSHPCCFTFRQKLLESEFEENSSRVMFNTQKAFLYACGLCAIYDFNRLGISHIKISGRSVLTDQIKNIRLVKEALGLLEKVASKEEFIFQVEKIARLNNRPCHPVYCYYLCK